MSLSNAKLTENPIQNLIHGHTSEDLLQMSNGPAISLCEKLRWDVLLKRIAERLEIDLHRFKPRTLRRGRKGIVVGD